MQPFLKALNVLRQVKEKPGRSSKMELLQRGDSPELRALLNVALNPYVTLGARVPRDIPKSKLFTAEEFDQVVTDLSARNLSGGSAQNALAHLVGGVPDEFRPLFVDLLNKEPRIGVELRTANTVWPGFIPEFSPQLAHDSATHTFPFFAVVEPKYDGLRALLCVTPTKTYFLSRKGLPLYNADHIVDEVSKTLPPGVYDGELFGATFHMSVGTAHRSLSAPTETLYYHVFDQLTWREWNQRNCKRPFKDRRQALIEMLSGPYRYIKVVEQRPAANMEEAKQHAMEWKQAGLEGAVIKDLTMPYMFKRTRAWLKLKFTNTFDLKVTGLGEGNGKYVGMLGDIVCSYKNREVRVGGGLSDEQRMYFWQHKDKLIGHTIEVLADKDETHLGSLRFPRFIRIREDK